MRPRLRYRGRRITIDDELVGAFLYPERNYWRPRTRSDCSRVPRPCPYVGCKHHLYLDLSPIGSIQVRFEGEPWDMKDSCALDVAERGGCSLRDTAKALGVVCERVRQIEETGLVKVRRLLNAERNSP